jgi:Beta-lactamase
LQKFGSGDDCRSFNRVLQQRTPECRIMSLLESAASLRPTKKVITTGLVTFCLLWADAPMPSHADTSPPQTAGVPILDGQIDKAIASLDAIASDVMKRSGIPGMSVAVVRDGRTVYARGFGLRKIGESQSVDANTVFQIASLSKSLAASVVAHQVGAGIVKGTRPSSRTCPGSSLLIRGSRSMSPLPTCSATARVCRLTPGMIWKISAMIDEPCWSTCACCRFTTSGTFTPIQISA